MKKITLLCLLLLSLNNSSIAQEWEWVYTPVVSGTPQDGASLEGITLDANGNIYSRCFTDSPIISFGEDTFDLPPGAESMSFVTKHDSSGNVLSVLPSTELGEVVGFDAFGNVYHIGGFKGTLLLGDLTLTNSDPDDISMFIAKTDSNGNYIWAKKANALGGTDLRIVSSADVVVDQYGNIYISGSFRGVSASFDNVSVTAIGSEDMFLVKYDTDGNVSWVRSGGGQVTLSYIVHDSQNYIYVAGSFRSPEMVFGEIALQNISLWSSFLIKYDTEGNIIWANKYGGDTNDVTANISCISLDESDNIITSGTFGGNSLPFGNITLTNPNSNSDPDAGGMFMAKIDSSGDTVWAKTDGGINGRGVVRDVHITNDGTIYTVGAFDSAEIMLGNTVLTNDGDANSFVAKLNSEGDYQWVNKIGGTIFTLAWTITVDEVINAAYITGIFSNNIVFNDEIFASESGNGFLAKLSLGPLANEEFHQNNLSVFPNPTKNILNINNEFSSGQVYNMTDMSGRTIKSGIVTNAIDVSTLSSGMYLLNTGGFSSKFIKE